MRMPIIALALLFSLCACAPNCQLAPVKTLSDSPFQQYRLSGLIVEPAVKPDQSAKAQDSNFQDVYHYTALQYSDVIPILKNLFSKPEQEGYASAPAVHLLCAVDDLGQSTPGFFSVGPAHFSATLTLVDPTTNKVIASKKCKKEASPSPENTPQNYCSQSTGLVGLSDAINQCAFEFKADMKAVTLAEQLPDDAAFIGTLTTVSGGHNIKKQSYLASIFGGEDKRHKDIIMNRVGIDILPNEITRKLIRTNKVFSNTGASSYKLHTTITDYTLSWTNLFGVGELQYTALTQVLKDGALVATITYTSPVFQLPERHKAFSAHADAIVAQLRKKPAAAPQAMPRALAADSPQGLPASQ